MTRGPQRHPGRRVTLLLATAVAALGGAVAFQPALHLDITHDGDRLVVVADGSWLETRTGPLGGPAVAVVASDTIVPPGGVRLRLQSADAVLEERLPRRFTPPGAGPAPIGDWWVDEGARRGVVWRRPVRVDGPFDLQAELRGRFHAELELVLEGPDGVAVGLRRGLNRNEITVRDATSRELLAWTSIDPSPAANAAGILATLLAALALGAGIAALGTIIGPGRASPAPRPTPSARRCATAAAVGLLAVLATGLSLWLAAVVLERLPHTADEAVQWLQAGWLLDGRLWQPVTAWQDRLDVPFTYLEGGRWLAQYPVLWPAALAPFAAVGAPWLLPPLLGGLQVLLVFLVGREVFDCRTGLLAGLLATLSPLARVLHGVTLSHAGASVLLLGFALLTLVAVRRERPILGLAAGVTLGLAFGMRPLPAVTAAVVAGFVLLWGAEVRGRWRRLAELTAGGLAGALPTLAANAAITGSPFRFGYALAEGRIYAFDNIGFGLANLDAILVHLGAQLLGWGWGLPGREVWLALPFALAALPFLLGRARAADRVLLLAFGAAALLLLGARAHGLYCYGARYLYEATPCLLLLIARGILELVGPVDDGGGAPSMVGRRSAVVVVAPALIAALAVLAAVSLPARLALYRGYFDVDRGLVAQVEAAGIERGLVLFGDRDWRDWLRAAPLNRPGPDPVVVFVRAAEDDGELLAGMADREPWWWSDGELRRYPPLALDDRVDLP